ERFSAWCAPLALAAECAEKVGDGGAMGAKRLDAGAARGEQAALGVDDIELAGDAVVVAKAREAQGLRERIGARRFGVVAFARARLRGEGGAHFAERALDGLLVLRQHGALAGARFLRARLEAPASEDRLREGDADQADAGASGEEVSQRGAFAAEGGGERN